MQRSAVKTKGWTSRRYLTWNSKIVARANLLPCSYNTTSMGLEWIRVAALCVDRNSCCFSINGETRIIWNIQFSPRICKHIIKMKNSRYIRYLIKITFKQVTYYDILTTKIWNDVPYFIIQGDSVIKFFREDKAKWV